MTPIVANSGQLSRFDLGNVVNPNTNNCVAETVTISYRAVVLNVLGNQQGTNLNNSAIVSWTGGRCPPSRPANIGVVEPNVTTTKTVTVGGSGTVGDAGDAVQYVITLRNNSGVNAYDVTVSDSLPLRAGTGSLIVSPSFSVIDTAGLVTAADFELVGNDTSGWILQTRAGVTFDMPTTPPARLPSPSTAPWPSLCGPTKRSPIRSSHASRVWTAIPVRSPPTMRTPPNVPGANGPGAGLNNYANNGTVMLDIHDPTPVKSLQTSSESTTSPAQR